MYANNKYEPISQSNIATTAPWNALKHMKCPIIYFLFHWTFLITMIIIYIYCPNGTLNTIALIGIILFPICVLLIILCWKCVEPVGWDRYRYIHYNDFENWQNNFDFIFQIKPKVSCIMSKTINRTKTIKKGIFDQYRCIHECDNINYDMFRNDNIQSICIPIKTKTIIKHCQYEQWKYNIKQEMKWNGFNEHRIIESIDRDHTKSIGIDSQFPTTKLFQYKNQSETFYFYYFKKKNVFYEVYSMRDCDLISLDTLWHFLGFAVFLHYKYRFEFSNFMLCSNYMIHPEISITKKICDYNAKEMSELNKHIVQTHCADSNRFIPERIICLIIKYWIQEANINSTKWTISEEIKQQSSWSSCKRSSKRKKHGASLGYDPSWFQ